MKFSGYAGRDKTDKHSNMKLQGVQVMGRWVVAIAGAVVGALFFGWLLSMLGISGIAYTIGVLIGSAVTSSAAGALFRPR